MSGFRSILFVLPLLGAACLPGDPMPEEVNPLGFIRVEEDAATSVSPSTHRMTFIWESEGITHQLGLGARILHAGTGRWADVTANLLIPEFAGVLEDGCLVGDNFRIVDSPTRHVFVEFDEVCFDEQLLFTTETSDWDLTPYD